MSASSVISSVSNVIYKDTVGFQFNWTGSPTGTFDVQGSLDYNQGNPQSNNSVNVGNWNSIPMVPALLANGSGSFLISGKLEQVSYPYIRFVYTNSTADGILNGYVLSKNLGGG